MRHPPSLDPDVLARGWQARNKELGVLPADVEAFLNACDTDAITVLGWELWVTDHQWDGQRGIEPCLGTWTGLVPVEDGTLGVWSYEGDSQLTREQLKTCTWRSELRPDLHPFVRINFTLDT